MSVASEYTPTQTACNGSLTAFSFDFPIFDTSDLKVYLKTVATGVKTLLTETTHYVVSATNNDYTNGGTVTTVATYSNAYEIIIERDIPYTQPTDLEQAGRIPSETLDDTHDRALMQIQQVNNKIQRALVMPVSDDSALDMELPNEIDRASQFLAFSADGEPVAANSFDGVVTASAYIQTLLVAADAATARTTLDALQNVFTTQGDILIRGASIEERLAGGLLDTVLKGQGAGAKPIFEKLALRDTGVHIGNGTRSTTGVQVITGVGYESSLIIFLVKDDTGSNRNWSVGFDSSLQAQCVYMELNGTVLSNNTARSIYILRSAGNYLNGLITAIGSDGFSITWTLVGTCAADFTYLCLP